MARRTKVDHLGLLCDVGELTSRLVGSADIPAFLGQIVRMVADRLQSAVCSIYLYEEATGQLVLRATHGLSADSVGRVRLAPGEGLTGMALKQLRPICTDCASGSPQFKGFDGINEEPFESFLAVPLHKGVEKIGVLVTQREQRRPFSERDVMVLQAAASQLANAIENARIFLDVSEQAPAAAPAELAPLVKGQAASRGVALGPAAIQDTTLHRRGLREKAFTRRYALEDFQAALDETARQLQQLQAGLARRVPEMASMIFDAHLMMLKDPTFLGEITDAIAAGTNPPDAVVNVGRKYADLLAANPHPYIREKAGDIEDVIRRLLGALVGTGPTGLAGGQGRVVIARDLYPSDVVKLASAETAAVVLVRGGVTSHVSILAQSLALPLVIADNPELLGVRAGTPILVDAEIGNIYLDPSQEVLDRYAAQRAAREQAAALAPGTQPRTHTADGTRVRLLANINLLTDLVLAREVQAEGIGLYRSEFPFLIRSALPTEEEQVLIYRRLVAGLSGKVTTFRTLDLGGDKLLAYYDDTREENPAMGLRSIRFTLRHRDVFAQQLRAVLRAGADAEAGPLRILFPMVSSLEEFRAARELLEQCRADLAGEGLDHCGGCEVGVMVEVPAAMEIVDDLADEADFLCVGTNDLIQFLLAVDRTNEKVASYFTPHHPAVLGALKRIADAAAGRGKEVSVCGEMAQVPRYVGFLAGIGVRTLSVSPGAIPRLQRFLSGLHVDRAAAAAAAALAERTIEGAARALACFDEAAPGEVLP